MISCIRQSNVTRLNSREKKKDSLLQSNNTRYIRLFPSFVCFLVDNSDRATRVKVKSREESCGPGTSIPCLSALQEYWDAVVVFGLTRFRDFDIPNGLSESAAAFSRVRTRMTSMCLLLADVRLDPEFSSI